MHSISFREKMMHCLIRVAGGGEVPPSQYFWENDEAGDGGEQGDALMPLLCSLG